MRELRRSSVRGWRFWWRKRSGMFSSETVQTRRIRHVSRLNILEAGWISLLKVEYCILHWRRRSSFSLPMIMNRSMLKDKWKERRFLFTVRGARSYATSFLNSKVINFCDLMYMSTCTTVERWYTDQKAKPTLNCSSSFRCFNCTIFLFVLVDQLYIHTERSMGVFIVCRCAVQNLKSVNYTVPSFRVVVVFLLTVFYNKFLKKQLK